MINIYWILLTEVIQHIEPNKIVLLILKHIKHLKENFELKYEVNLHWFPYEMILDLWNAFQNKE